MMQNLSQQFGALWESSDSPPDVFSFIRHHNGAAIDDALAVLLKDQNYRWKTDDPLKVEDYLARLPDLASDLDAKLQLVVGEFQARQAADTEPNIDEYTSRAPAHPNHLEGYAPVVHTVLTPGELIEALSLDLDHPYQQEANLASALWVVLDRDNDLSDEHGPDRLALLHIQAEAVWVCHNLWKEHDSNPFAVVLQDHGFGGNWARFGGDGSALRAIAQQFTLPELLLVGENTSPWPGYKAVSTVSGGVARNCKLYRCRAGE